jgi:hypothetical protein
MDNLGLGLALEGLAAGSSSSATRKNNPGGFRDVAFAALDTCRETA